MLRGLECSDRSENLINRKFSICRWTFKKIPSKNIFSSWRKMILKKNLGNIFEKIFCSKISKKIFRKSEIFPKIQKFLKKSPKMLEKIFFGKVENFFEHQGRSKICLQIEWEHSQPLKSTLKHSNIAPKGKPPVLVPLSRANCTNCLTISLFLGH